MSGNKYKTDERATSYRGSAFIQPHQTCLDAEVFERTGVMITIKCNQSHFSAVIVLFEENNAAC